MDNIMQISIWGIALDEGSLTKSQQKYVQSLPTDVPSVEWVWDEMDRVWNECGLDNKKPFSKQNIGSFYSHPVWIMNGLFTEIDPLSIEHRQYIANYLNERDLFEIADYGGGSGVLAAKLAESSCELNIDIIEPYPTEIFKQKLSKYPCVSYISSFSKQNYDCIIAQDVLEHIENPIEIAYEISQNVKVGGFVVYANCFYPVIKCHLPSTFYLRYTFKLVMKKMGLTYIGKITGAEHALVFQKNGKIELLKALNFASKIKFFGLLLNKIAPIASKVSRLLK